MPGRCTITPVMVLPMCTRGKVRNHAWKVHYHTCHGAAYVLRCTITIMRWCTIIRMMCEGAAFIFRCTFKVLRRWFDARVSDHLHYPGGEHATIGSSFCVLCVYEGSLRKIKYQQIDGTDHPSITSVILYKCYAVCR